MIVFITYLHLFKMNSLIYKINQHDSDQNFKSYDSDQNLVGLIINPKSDGNYLNKEELTELFPKFKEIIKN